eukprot:7379630-Prymnesium_polylepis.1
MEQLAVAQAERRRWEEATRKAEQQLGAAVDERAAAVGRAEAAEARARDVTGQKEEAIKEKLAAEAAIALAQMELPKAEEVARLNEQRLKDEVGAVTAQYKLSEERRAETKRVRRARACARASQNGSCATRGAVLSSAERARAAHRVRQLLGRVEDERDRMGEALAEARRAAHAVEEKLSVAVVEGRAAEEMARHRESARFKQEVAAAISRAEAAEAMGRELARAREAALEESNRLREQLGSAQLEARRLHEQLGPLHGEARRLQELSMLVHSLTRPTGPAASLAAADAGGLMSPSAALPSSPLRAPPTSFAPPTSHPQHAPPPPPELNGAMAVQQSLAAVASRGIHGTQPLSPPEHQALLGAPAAVAGFELASAGAGVEPEA